MHTKDAVLDDDRDRQKVKHVGKVFPHVGVAVLSITLGVEAVDLRDFARLVVAPKQGHSRGVAQFETCQQRNRLHAVVPSVHKIAF